MLKPKIVEEFKQVRKNLIDMLEDIDDGLEKITDNKLSIEETNTQNTSKQLTDNTNLAEYSLESSIQNDVNNIKQALSKIDSGTYGICLICGQPIKKDYLKAAPLSSHCLHCSAK